MQRPSVDLPQPDSPTRPSASPRATRRSTPSTARSTSTGCLRTRRGERGVEREVHGEAAHLEQRCGRAVRHARSAPRGSGRRWHARRRAGSAADRSSAQSGCAISQRGWKRQPEGGDTRSGGMPAIDSRCARRSSKSGTERSSARVYGMARRAEDLGHRPRLDDPRGVHHGHALARLRDDREVVRDEHDRHARLAAQAREQVQDLILDRHVERGRRLVAEQQLRLAGERDRDHDALPQAARELVRVGRGSAARGRGRRPAAAARARARAPALRALPEPHARPLGDLLADAHHRVERRHRLLEDHADAVAAQPRRASAAESACAVEHDLAAGDAARGRGAVRGSRAASCSCRSPTRRRGRARRRAATSRRDAVDGLDDAARRRDLDAQVAHREDRIGELTRAPAGRPGRRRAGRVRGR